MKESTPANTTKDLASLTLQTEYRTGESDPVADFYQPCLAASIRYDRAVGYFRSTVFAVIGQSIIEFAKRGGKVRIICSPDLAEEDFRAMMEGYERREKIAAAALEAEIDRLLSDARTKPLTEALATLVSVGVMEIKIAIRPTSRGIYHEKIGIFFDHRDNVVTFKGSANETWSGWHEHGNFESIEVFCSYLGGTEAKRVRKHQEYFEKLWNGRVSNLVVMEFPEAVKEKLCMRAAATLDELELKAETTIRRGRVPFAHQTLALQAWRDNDRRGIFEHATGSGKTFTAILAIKEHLESGDVVLVLVPSKLLLEQWNEELKRELPMCSILLAGAGYTSWRLSNRLRDFSSSDRDLGPRIVLATMQTACSDTFRLKLSQGEHLLVVADEVHEMGSCERSKLFSIEAKARLGLSATPHRFGDPEGTYKVFNYFGKVLQPPFTLVDAIKSGRLVKYEYFPHTVRLTASETDAWTEATEKIKREIARLSHGENAQATISDAIKMMLIQRSRIAKKAAAKIGLASEVLSKNYEEGQRWLVYCEDQDQLSQVVDALKNVGLTVNQYHTAMCGDPEASLEWFRILGGILVSIRCLDQGVDIPEISHALILASSQNPRQFIQRRGRVLRIAPGKFGATIHDAIVIPPSIYDEPEQTALARAELQRAIEFSGSAVNRFADAELRSIAVEIGLDIAVSSQVGYEEDETEEQNG